MMALRIPSFSYINHNLVRTFASSFFLVFKIFLMVNRGGDTSTSFPFKTKFSDITFKGNYFYIKFFLKTNIAGE